ncbi:glycosyltransferase family 2 protein [bacterium]|nr:glycosyltransferase family 2 protein [bacterium]
MQPKVVTVVLNYNTAKDTIECIASLNAIDYDNNTILVVDNGSDDESVELIHSVDPDVKVIENKDNLGFSEGNNIGIRYAIGQKAEYAVLLNSDTVVEKSFLTHLIEEVRQRPLAATAGPLIMYSGKERLVWSAGGDAFLLRPRNILDGKKRPETLETSTDIDYLPGCCLLIKLSYIGKIGFLDPDFFLYGEDVDYGLRVKKNNYKNLFVPNSIIYHKVSVTSGGELSPWARYYGTRNRFLLVKKHASLLSKLLFYLILLPLLTIKNVIVLSGKPESLRALFLGIKDGIKNKYGKNTELMARKNRL